MELLSWVESELKTDRQQNNFCSLFRFHFSSAFHKNFKQKEAALIDCLTNNSIDGLIDVSSIYTQNIKAEKQNEVSQSRATIFIASDLLSIHLSYIAFSSETNQSS